NGGWRDPPRLRLVTRGGQAVGDGAAPIAMAQAPLWGFARTLALEHAELRCTCVDLAPAPSERDAAWLLCERSANDREDQVALRQEGRYVARLVRSRFGAQSAEEEPLAGIRPDASYLITGGLGGLGIEVARWMVEQGARHIALVGRNGPGESARAT